MHRFLVLTPAFGLIGCTCAQPFDSDHTIPTTADTADTARDIADTADDSLPWVGEWADQIVSTGSWSHPRIVWFDGSPIIVVSDDDSAGRLVWWPVDSGRVEEIAASARSAVAAVDGSTAHVAYVDPLTDELVYARGPGIWTKETITAGSVVAGGLDIAVGPLGQPSVVYRTSDGVIELGRRTSSGWSAYQVATDSVSPSLDVDADGRHWIVYSAIVQGVPRVTLVDFLDGELGTPLLFSNSRTDMSAIAIDSANAVQLALGFEDAPCDWRDGTTNIVAETPDTPGSPDCYSPGIQVDSGRRAHLAWSSQSTVGVHYARWAGYAGSPWQHFQPVDDSDYAGVTEVSMVLAPDETAHFAFVAGADSETPILVYGAYWR